MLLLQAASPKLLLSLRSSGCLHSCKRAVRVLTLTKAVSTEAPSTSRKSDSHSLISRNNQCNAFLIGVAGGTASGKTSVCKKIMEAFQSNKDYHRHVISITQDSFYRNLTNEERANISQFNFDHPMAFDFAETLQALRELKLGRGVHIPLYDFVTSSRVGTVPVASAGVVLFEGILAFHSQELRELFDMKIFVDTDADTRLARRMRRDVAERGRDVDRVLDQYERFVKPSFEQFILPTKQHADIILPRGAENVVAVELIVQHIKSLLQRAAVNNEL